MSDVTTAVTDIKNFDRSGISNAFHYSRAGIYTATATRVIDQLLFYTRSNIEVLCFTKMRGGFKFIFP